MNKAAAFLILLLLTLAIFGCDKERIVESTEYIKDVQYIQQPPDTIFFVDTIYSHDSSTTVVYDTIYQVTNHYDTVYSHSVDTVTTVQTIHDTVIVSRTDTVNIATTDTVTILDTVTVTNTIIDTVLVNQSSANSSLAFAALTYHSNTLVFDFINTEYGITEGYVFYLNEFQSDVTQSAANVWDIYGLIDFWTTDFTGFEALEFYWRLTYTGGDPANPNNWTITDPPGSSAGSQPGLHAVDNGVTAERIAR